MLQITEDLRNTIVQYIENPGTLVSPIVGANLIQIALALKNLVVIPTPKETEGD